MSQNPTDKFSGPRFSKGPVFEQWIVFVRKNRLKEAGRQKLIEFRLSSTATKIDNHEVTGSHPRAGHFTSSCLVRLTFSADCSSTGSSCCGISAYGLKKPLKSTLTQVRHKVNKRKIDVENGGLSNRPHMDCIRFKVQTKTECMSARGHQCPPTVIMQNVRKGRSSYSAPVISTI